MKRRAPARRWPGALRWRIARVQGRSMQPTLSPGAVVLVDLAQRSPILGDVVVVWLPGRPQAPPAIKRLVAVVPEGWWVERDNVAEGIDSWHVGAVPASGLVGVVRWQLWPRPRRLAEAPRPRPRPPA